MAEFESAAENITSLPLHEQFLEILKRAKKSSAIAAVLISVILMVVLESINFSGLIGLVIEKTPVSVSSEHSTWKDTEDQRGTDDFESKMEISQEEEINSEDTNVEEFLQASDGLMKNALNTVSVVILGISFVMLIISAIQLGIAVMTENPEVQVSAIQSFIVAVVMIGASFLPRILK